MWNKISHQILTRGSFVGIEYLQTSSGFCFNVVILEKRKGLAEIAAIHSNIIAIEKLTTIIDKKFPVYLVINSKGILNRKLDYVPNSKLEALQAVFPSAKVDDFLVQQVPTKKECLVSIIREDKVQEIIGQLKEIKVEVIEVFAGNFLLQYLLPVLPASVKQLPLQDFCLQIDHHQVIAFDKINHPAIEIPVGDRTVMSTDLPALNVAFLGITQAEVLSLDVAYNEQAKASFIYKRLFHYTSIVVLGFFFLSLLLNYFLFEQYQTDNQALKLELSQQQNLLTQRDTLAQKLEQKKEVLGDQINVGNSKTSFYADQIAASLPNSIQLLSLTVYPAIEVDNYSFEDKAPRYETNKIKLKGACQASIFYNDWKQNVQALSWVKSLQNISYQNDQNGMGIFELEITIK